jgi:hypothetical protein
MKRIVSIAVLAIGLIGCKSSEPQATVDQQTGAPYVPGVVVTKPFIAWPHPFSAPGAGAQPSILLQLHARTDSPIPISEYGKQKAYPLSAFALGPSLSADELQRRLGPPAQLADYSDPWFVYRLTYGRNCGCIFRNRITSGSSLLTSFTARKTVTPATEFFPRMKADRPPSPLLGPREEARLRKKETR